MKRLVLDLDGTITVDDHERDYAKKMPNAAVIAKVREYKALGFEIIIQTARNMNSYNNSVGKISAHTLPVIIDWLKQHDVPFDEIHVGKPWCGFDGFYVDDRAIRPDEFVELSADQINDLVGIGR